MKTSNQLRIALIGSRKLEKEPQHYEDVLLCYKICYRLANLGITFTSGLCTLGMDGIAQKAYSEAVENGRASLDQFEVYVYDQKAIKNSPLPNKHVARIRNPETINRTLLMASEVHDAWHNCDEYARSQHSRNCHQIFGYTLDNPVDAVITWCPLIKGNIPIGGTATALKLAAKAGIPIFNLWQPNKDATILQIRDFLRNQNIENVR